MEGIKVHKRTTRLLCGVLIFVLAIGLLVSYPNMQVSAQSGSTSYVTIQKTHVYQSKHTKSKSLKRMGIHEVVSVISVQSSWANVKVGKVKGYVPVKHLKKTSTFESVWTAKTVKLKSGRNQSSKTISTLSKNKKLIVLQKMGSWTKVMDGSKKGYVPATFLKSSLVEYSESFQSYEQIVKNLNRFKHPEYPDQPMFVQRKHYEQTVFEYQSSKSKKPSIGVTVHEENNGIYFTMYYKGSEIYAFNDPMIEQNYRDVLKNISNSIYKKGSPEAGQFYAFCIEQLEMVLDHASKHRYDELGNALLARGTKRIGKEDFFYSNLDLSVDLSLDTRQ